jgi:hypothetical protein
MVDIARLARNPWLNVGWALVFFTGAVIAGLAYMDLGGSTTDLIVFLGFTTRAVWDAAMALYRFRARGLGQPRIRWRPFARRRRRRQEAAIQRSIQQAEAAMRPPIKLRLERGGLADDEPAVRLVPRAPAEQQQRSA